MGGTDPVFDGFCEECKRAGDEYFPRGCKGCVWDDRKNRPSRFVKFKEVIE